MFCFARPCTSGSRCAFFTRLEFSWLGSISRLGKGPVGKPTSWKAGPNWQSFTPTAALPVDPVVCRALVSTPPVRDFLVVPVWPVAVQLSVVKTRRAPPSRVSAPERVGRRVRSGLGRRVRSGNHGRVGSGKGGKGRLAGAAGLSCVNTALRATRPSTGSVLLLTPLGTAPPRAPLPVTLVNHLAKKARSRMGSRTGMGVGHR